MFINHSLDYFDGALVSFHTRRYAKFICFKDHARVVLEVDQTGSKEDSTQNIDKAIHAECKDLMIDKENFDR